MSSSPSRVLRHTNLQLVGGTEVDVPARVPRVLRQPAVNASFEGHAHASEPVAGQADQRGYDEGFEAGRESARQQLMSAANALQGALVLLRMDLRHLVSHREIFAKPRVVFHRAGAEQADAHHPEGLLRQVQVMTQHVGLRHLRQRRLGGGARDLLHDRTLP